MVCLSIQRCSLSLSLSISLSIYVSISVFILYVYIYIHISMRRSSVFGFLGSLLLNLGKVRKRVAKYRGREDKEAWERLKKRERERERAFLTPNGESLETASLHGSVVFYFWVGAWLCFATFGVFFFSYWVSLCGTHSF